MPFVEQRISLHEKDPITTTVTRDVDDICILRTDSDYGYVLHRVDITRDGVTKRVTATTHTVSDA